MTAPLYPSEDLRKRLEELGVPRDKHNLAELGEMLPSIIEIYTLNFYKLKNSWHIEYGCGELGGEQPQTTAFLHLLQANTEANARAKMRIYLLENKLIKAQEKKDEL